MKVRQSRRVGSSRDAGRRSESGYNLVVMAMIFTVMNVMIAMALPSWSQIIQREKEEELIFRGLQYAEAIRVFQIRFKRYPVRLEELIEVEPRCIRQLWKNPMSKSGAWEPIFVAQPNPGNRRRGNRSDVEEDSRDQAPGEGEPGTGEVKIGPIRGVMSAVGGDAIKIFDGKNDYGSWQFTVELLEGRPLERVPFGLGGKTNVAVTETIPVNARDVGRPWPPGVIPPVMIRQPQPGSDRNPTGGNDSDTPPTQQPDGTSDDRS